jgi:hypothetical protein
MLFGEIALSFTHASATKSPARDLIIAKLMPLCGSIGAFNKQKNGNDTVGATLTADQARYCMRGGTVVDASSCWPHDDVAWFASCEALNAGIHPQATNELNAVFWRAQDGISSWPEHDASPTMGVGLSQSHNEIQGRRSCDSCHAEGRQPQWRFVP